MESILNQLLAIQGATEQQTIDGLIETRTEAPRRPQEREEGPERVEPPAEAQRPSEGPPEPQKRSPPPMAAEKPSPEMLEAWRMAFRIFTKYAPALKRAAAQDGETNEEACRLFSEASQEANALYRIGGDAEILAMHVYDMLGDAWKKARKDQ